jgi:hypothetical protein
MSVVTCKGDAYYAPVGARCTFCGHRSYPPFVAWSGSVSSAVRCRNDNPDDDSVDPVVICNDCCRELTRGLTRDMQEVVREAENRETFRRFCCQPVQPEDVRQ